MSTIDAHFIHEDTKMRLAKFSGAYCIAFDIGKRSMLGLAVEKPVVAKALSNYFKQMAKALEARNKGRKNGKQKSNG